MWSIGKVGAVGSSGPTGIRTPISVRPASGSARFHSHPPIANFAKLNRQTPEVERLASHRKQTPAICSNRQKINFSPDENQPFNFGRTKRPSVKWNLAAAALPFLLLHPLASFAAAPPIHRQAAAPVLAPTVCEITAHPL